MPVELRPKEPEIQGKSVVLTCGDLLGISRESVARIRSLVADRVPPERLLLNHSHTHAGPTTAPMRSMDSPDAPYVDLVERWTATAVLEALRRLAPARLAFGTSAKVFDFEHVDRFVVHKNYRWPRLVLDTQAHWMKLRLGPLGNCWRLLLTCIIHE